MTNQTSVAAVGGVAPFAETAAASSEAWPTRGTLLVVATLAATFLWAYWHTLTYLVDAWNTQPDYSHGFLVPALSLLFLWMARDSFPGASQRIAWIEAAPASSPPRSDAPTLGS